jgi:hypothetical protein
MSRDEVAEILKVSRSLVDKWCSETEHSCPSYVQMFRLPVSFQLALHSALDSHPGIVASRSGSKKR